MTDDELAAERRRILRELKVNSNPDGTLYILPDLLFQIVDPEGLTVKPSIIVVDHSP